MKISIIVPVYNAEKFLKQCFDSLINQTLNDIEIIAIDDCSTDNSFKILQEYEQKYPSKVHVFKNKRNCGVGFTRNVGLDKAKGFYIGFIDSDDYVSKNMYEDMYNAAVANDFPQIISNRIVFTSSDKYLKMNFPNDISGYSYDPLKKPFKVLEESPAVCNKIFLHSYIKDKQFLVGKRWEDVHFSFANLFNASKVLHINSTGYFYRKINKRGLHSIGYKPHNHLADIFDIAEAIKKDTMETGRYEILKKEITMIQIKYILLRMVEVLKWEISEEDREKIIYKMHQEIKVKYIDWRFLNHEYLSASIGIINLEEIENIINKKEKKIYFDIKK